MITECRAKARICAAGIRDTKLVFEPQPILSHNSRRARGERIQSRRVTVEAPVAYAHEQRAGSDESAVVGDEIYIRIVFYTSVNSTSRNNSESLIENLLYQPGESETPVFDLKYTVTVVP